MPDKYLDSPIVVFFQISHLLLIRKNRSNVFTKRHGALTGRLSPVTRGPVYQRSPIGMHTHTQLSPLCHLRFAQKSKKTGDIATQVYQLSLLWINRENHV